MTGRRKRKFHEHYCHTVTPEKHHDHRWQCQRDPCLLAQTAFCQVCNCGRELMPRKMRDKTLIYECPLRHTELGHDARLIQETPVLPDRPLSNP